MFWLRYRSHFHTLPPTALLTSSTELPNVERSKSFRPISFSIRLYLFSKFHTKQIKNFQWYKMLFSCRVGTCRRLLMQGRKEKSMGKDLVLSLWEILKFKVNCLSNRKVCSIKFVHLCLFTSSCGFQSSSLPLCLLSDGCFRVSCTMQNVTREKLR